MRHLRHLSPRMRLIFGMVAIWGIAFSIIALPSPVAAAEYVVYSVYRGIDLGTPGETPQKDYYINMGTSQGVHEGTVLNVFRRISTYDLLTEKLFKDVTFPIAKVKVIHAESGVAIARLEKMNAPEKSPSTTPAAIMIGDIVKAGGSLE